jgi:hypothetical protein
VLLSFWDKDMTLQRSVAVRDAQLNAVETAIGTTPKLQVRTGAQPANCAAADSGTLLCEIDLPSDWMAAAASGSKAKAGTWLGTGVAAGDAGHYRIKDSTGTTCHEQGSITATAGGGDATMDNITVSVGMPVVVNSFAWTAGNA